MIQLLHGDCIEMLRTLPAQSVQCCVTSPPYWGLRDYGTAEWEGGDPNCDHKDDWFIYPVSDKQASNSASGSKAARHVCPKCGARRIDNQIGLEQTPQEYVRRLVTVFDEVRRVLRDDGTLWLNLGDSYAGNKNGNTNGVYADRIDPKKSYANTDSFKKTLPPDCKPKDLIGIPWRVAFALQEAGWWLRSEITWCKRAPMPESVRDRPTSATEKIFLLAKSARYYYDAEAVRECAAESSIARISQRNFENQTGGPKDYRNNDVNTSRSSRTTLENFAKNPGRNLWNYWMLSPEPYREAHFATFPTEIPRRAIKAGSKQGDVVLDPFAGSGTTGAVCVELGRDFIGIELNAEYVKLAEERIGKSPVPLMVV